MPAAPSRGRSGPRSGASWAGPPLLWSSCLLLAPLGMTYAAVRAYLDERAKHSRLVLLHQTVASLASASGLQEVGTELLTGVRNMFGADIAELSLFPVDPGEPVLRARLGPGRTRHLLQPIDDDDVDLPVGLDPALLSSTSPGAVRDVRPGVRAGSAMAVTLRADGRPLGRLVVADRAGDVSTFDEADLELLRALAVQVGLSLENRRLEKSLDQLGALKEQLHFDAHHDPLTGLANRALLNKEIDRALAGEAATSSAVGLLLDLDDFKTVNDSLGHQAGDDLLVEVASRLTATLEDGDLASRLGGDEFFVLLRPGSTVARGVQVAASVLAEIGAPTALAGGETSLHASIGIAELVGGGAPGELLRNADSAMYKAKHDGKNRYRLFQSHMHTEAVERLELRSALQKAVERDQLLLVYQPMVELATGQIREAEALVRWAHPDRGLLAPYGFIGLAEETGLIVSIGKWVLGTALEQLAVWRRTVPGGEHLRISVNLSARQLVSDDLVDDVSAALRSAALPAGCLVLEITESVLIADPDAALRSLQSLKRLGVALAIDDFGTGYSSLSLLRVFPIDVLKLDKAFVDDLGSDNGHALVGAIAGLAAALGLRTVAEGIETPAQADAVRALGYHVGQGYHFSSPVSAEGFADIVGRQPHVVAAAGGPAAPAAPAASPVVTGPAGPRSAPVESGS